MSDSESKPPVDGKSPGIGSVRPSRRTHSVATTSASTEELCWALIDRVCDENKPQRLVKLLGILRAHLSFATDAHANRYSATNNRSLLGLIKQCPTWSNDLVQDAQVVEFGCGAINPLGTLLPFVALGARTCIGLDLDEIQSPRLAARALFDAAAELLLCPELYFGPDSIDPERVRCNLEGIPFLRLRDGDLGALPSDRMRAIVVSAEETGLESASTQVIVSNSFLEHVSDADAVLQEMARIAKPGGLGVHLIDGSDHRAYGDPDRDELAFLTEEPGGHYFAECNRLRPLQFVERFERSGFEVLRVDGPRRIEVTPEFRATLVEPFSELSDEVLSVVGARVFVRRR